jgi:nitrite reductase/ring-hydroxylating ferredoxin subunit
MSRFVKVLTTSVFNDVTGGKLVNAGGQEISIFKLDDDYYAIENTCPHAGGPLAEGEVEDGVVTCPWHGSRFNIKTGTLLAPPATRGVKSFPVRITGSDVEIEIE